MFFPLYDDVPARRAPLVTVGLILANAGVFLWLLTKPEAVQERITFQRGFVPARIAQLTSGQPLLLEIPRPPDAPPQPGVPPQVVQFPPDRGAIYLSLLSCMFLHGGWMHLLGNMWFLWLFGNNVEDRLGHVLYLLFYLAGGVFASICHWLPSPDSLVPVIGASGAVSAVLGAYAVTWPFAKVKTVMVLIIFITLIDLPALIVLGVWFVTQVIEALTVVQFPMGGGVAWWAHIGGFVAGFLTMPLLGLLFGPRRTVPERHSFEEFFSQ